MLNDRIVLRWVETRTLLPHDLVALEAMLAGEERSRAESIRFEDGRRTFIVAHACKRLLLARFAGRPPNSWKFRKGRFGKPEPILEPDQKTVSINISHTKDFAVFAIYGGNEIGVDAEWAGRRVSLNLADRHFAPEETALLRASHEDQRNETFLRLWTLKEAYAKAVGKGLNLALQSYAFQLDPVRLLYEENTRPGTRWSFLQYRTKSGHIIALAVRVPCESHFVISKGPVDIGKLAEGFSHGQI